MRLWKLLAVAVLILVGVLAEAETLSLDKFLQSVQDGNQEYKASREGEEAARLYGAEGSLVYSPTLISSAQYSDDAKPSFIPQFQYDKILTQNYTLGIAQQTSIGLKGQLVYSMTSTDYRGISPYVAPYSEGRPVLELSQSLWRNDFGRETRAQVSAIRANAKATEHGQAFSRQATLVEAEAAYWRLAIARQNLDLSKENLNRAEKIFAWAKRRLQLSLADRSEFLLATTGQQARRLEFRVATDELRAASVAFNSSRGVDSDQVADSLEPLSKELIEKLRIPERAGDRQDVLSAQQQSEALKAQATMNREKNQPNLEVFGSYAFNSREPSKEDALSESWDGSKPTKVIGLRFSSPLAFGKMGDTQDGYAKQIKSAEYRYERQRFLQEQNWRDLALRFNEAKVRLLAAEELEANQREKLDYERKRQENGRSTLFQVLTFETDYLGAQGVRLRTWAELLQISAQMKLYGVK